MRKKTIYNAIRNIWTSKLLETIPIKTFVILNKRKKRKIEFEKKREKQKIKLKIL